MCICTCIHVYICIHTCVPNTFVHMQRNTVNPREHSYSRSNFCFIYGYVYICVHTHIYIYMYTLIYIAHICIYAYMYIPYLTYLSICEETPKIHANTPIHALIIVILYTTDICHKGKKEYVNRTPIGIRVGR